MIVWEKFSLSWKLGNDQFLKARRIVMSMLALDGVVPSLIVESLYRDGEEEVVEFEILHAHTCQCVGCSKVPVYSLDYCRAIIDQGGGIIPLTQYMFGSPIIRWGQPFGLLVGGKPLACPPGWLFVEIEGLTATELKALIDRCL